MSDVTGTHPCTHFASITMHNAACAELHSHAPMPIPIVLPSPFQETLACYSNDSLWENLSVDGDREWICKGLAMETLCIAHDGSYMAGKSNDLCLAGVIIYCCASQFWVKVLVAEPLDSASSYQEKLLGITIVLMILNAATGCGVTPAIQITVLFCGNHGVISYGSHSSCFLRNRNRLTSSDWSSTWPVQM